MTPKAYVFKGFNLQSSPYQVTGAPNLYDSPDVDITAYDLARTDGAAKVYDRYKPRSFVLNGNIKVATPTDLEPAFDALKLALLKQVGDLATDWGTGTRYFNCECKNIAIIRDRGHNTQVGWSGQFYMAQPFSTDNVTRDIMTAVVGNTTGSLTASTNNIGTYFAAPYITLTLTGITPNNSDVTITIGNPATNESISFTGQFANGDVVTIDCLNKQIFKGVTLLPGVGHFPTWMPGSGIISYSDTATTRTISLAATYIARYL